MPVKKKIAILGGGTGSLAAAHYLTQVPNWQTHYDITVYQQGWRLGGKGASGRNAKQEERIEEHGLHIWAGFYDNAFRMIRDCYGELNRAPGDPLATWDEAFKPHSFVTFVENLGDHWENWSADFPTNNEIPGDGGELPTIWDYVQLVIDWMVGHLEASPHPAVKKAHSDPEAFPALPHWLDEVISGAEGVATDLVEDAEAAAATLEKTTLHAAARLVKAMSGDANDHRASEHRSLLWLLEQAVKWLASLAEGEIDDNQDLRRLYLMIDFAAAHVRGFIADGVIFQGLDVINDQEWTAWLKKHGASQLTLKSPLVRAPYEYAFAFKNGDSSKPSIEAGTCIRGLLRLVFTYKGALFFEMQAGMGDTIFAPLYQELKDRGVQFEFFRRVTNLGLSADKKSVETIEIARQVNLNHPEYQPLVTVKGLGCWPSEPRYSQIKEGAQLEADQIDLESDWTPWTDVGSETLTVGTDFDLVVLGIPVGALEPICNELIATDNAWKNMVTKVETTQTQALQLWLTPSAAGLGWKKQTTILTAYADPLATWADLSHLIPREDWPAGTEPKSCAYFCGPFHEASPIPPPSDHGFPAREHDRAKQISIDWLNEHAAHLWPNAAGATGFAWRLLADPAGGSGLERFESQYWRANIDRSGRYVLSVPGSGKYRLKAGDSRFDNLVLAGDWVDTGLNAGCIEAAVMAGMAASQAICGSPTTIVGYDAPANPPLIDVGDQPPAAASTLLSGAAKPLYIQRGGEQVMQQPFGLADVRFYSFMFEADYGALQKLCQSQLNDPTAGAVEYHPLVPAVMASFYHVERNTSLDPPYSNWGGIPSTEMGFWVPVVKIKRHLGIPFAEELLWFMPYMFVSNAWAMASGREVFGIPKAIGEITLPDANQAGALNFDLSTLVIKKFDPGSTASTQQLLRIRGTDPGPGQPPDAWADLATGVDEFYKALIGNSTEITLPGLGLVVEIAELLASGKVPIVFMKQFRDVEDGSRASYQAVVEAPAQITNLHQGGSLAGDYFLTIDEFESHPIATDLGLKSGTEQKAFGGWKVLFNMNLENGKEIWRA